MSSSSSAVRRHGSVLPPHSSPPLRLLRNTIHPSVVTSAPGRHWTGLPLPAYLVASSSLLVSVPPIPLRHCPADRSGWTHRFSCLCVQFLLSLCPLNCCPRRHLPIRLLVRAIPSAQSPVLKHTLHFPPLVVHFHLVQKQMVGYGSGSRRFCPRFPLLLRQRLDLMLYREDVCRKSGVRVKVDSPNRCGSSLSVGGGPRGVLLVGRRCDDGYRAG